MAPVDGFFLQIREETLTPGVVPRFAYSGKALQDSVLLGPAPELSDYRLESAGGAGGVLI